MSSSAGSPTSRWTTPRCGAGSTLRARARTQGSEVPFATIDLASERAIGSTRYMTIAPEHRRLEIGWTWLGVAFQRSGVNREAKLLQLSHAFETLGAERVEFKTHARNVASRTALLGIGATFEGVLRHHTIMPDGSNRDSAFYGVIAPEWPAVKARLESARLAMTDVRPADPYRRLPHGRRAVPDRDRRRPRARGPAHPRPSTLGQGEHRRGPPAPRQRAPRARRHVWLFRHAA